MATTPDIEAALIALRIARLSLFEASQARNKAMRQKTFNAVPPLNTRIAAARVEYLAARAVVAALLEP